MEDTSNNGEARGIGTGAIIAILLVIALAIGGYFYFTQSGQQEAPNTDGSDSTADIILGTDRGTGPVARVNGETISRQAYEDSVVSVAENVRAQGVDITDPTVQTQLKEQVLTTLVNTELLVQSATAAGISVSDAEVEAQLDALAAQFGGAEALQAQLVSFNVSEAQLRDDLRTQLLIEAYIASKVDMDAITVTDAEVQALYDSLATSGNEVPDLATIRPQIEAQLQSQKQQTRVSELVEELRADASIEILV